MKAIETFLPIFPGFYNTVFEPECSDIIYSYNQENDTNFDYDDFDWDYSEYYNQTAKNCCDAIEKLLKENGIIESIKFQNVVSPKYYNHSNDSINIEVEINIDKLVLFIANNKDDFDTYVRSHYTSCDDFTSFYSNNGDDWFKSLINDDFKKSEHCFGALLEFVCGLLIDGSIEMVYWLYEQLENYDYCEPNFTLIEQD